MLNIEKLTTDIEKNRLKWFGQMEKKKTYHKECVCVPMPTHCTIMCFGFHARWIDGVECGLFLNHAPLG